MLVYCLGTLNIAYPYCNVIFSHSLTPTVKVFCSNIPRVGQSSDTHSLFLHELLKKPKTGVETHVQLCNEYCRTWHFQRFIETDHGGKKEILLQETLEDKVAVLLKYQSVLKKNSRNEMVLIMPQRARL